MGIRYYAYEFDSDRAEEALADPHAVIGADPLADAWGLEPGFVVGATEFTQSVPEHDMLYLDKSWSELQQLTGPQSGTAYARPAYRMFEGAVTFTAGGMEWSPWVRALVPIEVALIARDLESISDADIETGLNGIDSSMDGHEEEVAYVTQYLHRAREFAVNAAARGRGFAYLIG